MTVFVFHVKRVGNSELDDIALCRDFSEVKSVFDDRVARFRHDGLTEVKCEEPVFNEDAESDDESIDGGAFEFIDGNNRIVGEVYPYWLKD